VLPNKEERLLVPPLLRTVRETFASYGSSILSPFNRAAVICHGHSISFANFLYVVQYFNVLSFSFLIRNFIFRATKYSISRYGFLSNFIGVCRTIFLSDRSFNFLSFVGLTRLKPYFQYR
jgi:hypothetical protein